MLSRSPGRPRRSTAGPDAARAGPPGLREDRQDSTRDSTLTAYALIFTAHGYLPATYSMTADGNGHPATAETAPRTNGQIAGVVRAGHRRPA
ncbi:hypothetical protein ACWC9U_08080 [Streptomyces sp. 900116325]